MSETPTIERLWGFRQTSALVVKLCRNLIVDLCEFGIGIQFCLKAFHFFLGFLSHTVAIFFYPLRSALIELS